MPGPAVGWWWWCRPGLSIALGSAKRRETAAPCRQIADLLQFTSRLHTRASPDDGDEAPPRDQNDSTMIEFPSITEIDGFAMVWDRDCAGIAPSPQNAKSIAPRSITTEIWYQSSRRLEADVVGGPGSSWTACILNFSAAPRFTSPQGDVDQQGDRQRSRARDRTAGPRGPPASQQDRSAGGDHVLALNEGANAVAMAPDKPQYRENFLAALGQVSTDTKKPDWIAAGADT